MIVERGGRVEGGGVKHARRREGGMISTYLETEWEILCC